MEPRPSWVGRTQVSDLQEPGLLGPPLGTEGSTACTCNPGSPHTSHCVWGEGLCFEATFVGFFFFIMFKLSEKYVC